MRNVWMSVGFAAGIFVMAAPAQAADAAAGEQVFNSQCMICHSPEQGGPNKIGPNLFGIAGRAAGAVEGYMYSNAMKNSGITWTEDELRVYLQAPAKKVPGTKMGFPGFSNEADEDNIIAYLETLK